MSTQLRDIRRIREALAARVDVVDRDAEAARYGRLQWEGHGRRCYAQATPDGSELTLTGGGATVTYRIVGMDAEEII